MGTFDQCFLFLRNPRGGVEDLDRMKQAGFAGVFCNVGDFPADQWSTIRTRAAQRAMFCGPWLRTQSADGSFSQGKLQGLIDVADSWGSPLIVNSEKEIDHSGSTLTTLIRDAIGDRDGALSMEPVPFASVDWTPLADIPVLPQVFGDSGFYDPIPLRDMWWSYGIRCVFPTYGTYGYVQASDYPLQAPYSLYTADDCAGDYGYWAPRAGTYVGCQQSGGTDVTQIGNQDGIVAMFNRLRDLDPAGTLLVKEGNKWPDISTLPSDLSKWKAYDKGQRTLQILKDDHDAGA